MMFVRGPALFLVFVMLGHTAAFKTFQDRIPNGDSVPHPCKPNHLWYGVGHKNREGGGSTNPFGTDFKTNGYVSRPSTDIYDE